MLKIMLAIALKLKVKILHSHMHHLVLREFVLLSLVFSPGKFIFMFHSASRGHINRKYNSTKYVVHRNTTHKYYLNVR